VKLIPFTVSFAGREDTCLKDKLLAELPGILNWVISGCLEWQRDGLGEPEVVTVATGEYQEAMDDLGRFVEEFCEVGEGFTVLATSLHDAFEEATGVHLSPHSFADRLWQKGFRNRDPETGKHFQATSGPNAGRRLWRGLRLRRQAEAAEFVKNIKPTL
jgi:putative DNA primase/helicase